MHVNASVASHVADAMSIALGVLTGVEVVVSSNFRALLVESTGAHFIFACLVRSVEVRPRAGAYAILHRPLPAAEVPLAHRGPLQGAVLEQVALLAFTSALWVLNRSCFSTMASPMAGALSGDGDAMPFGVGRGRVGEGRTRAVNVLTGGSMVGEGAPAGGGIADLLTGAFAVASFPVIHWAILDGTIGATPRGKALAETPPSEASGVDDSIVEGCMLV